MAVRGCQTAGLPAHHTYGSAAPDLHTGTGGGAARLGAIDTRGEQCSATAKSVGQMHHPTSSSTTQARRTRNSSRAGAVAGRGQHGAGLGTARAVEGAIEQSGGRRRRGHAGHGRSVMLRWVCALLLVAAWALLEVPHHLTREWAGHPLRRCGDPPATRAAQSRIYKRHVSQAIPATCHEVQGRHCMRAETRLTAPGQ